jgi:molecular chaperone GrpE (heat shock protein)
MESNSDAYGPEDVDDILKNADTLIEQLEAELKMDLEDQRQLEFEARMANLKKRAAEVKQQLSKEDLQRGRVSGGIHEAIESLVDAIRSTARILS